MSENNFTEWLNFLDEKIKIMKDKDDNDYKTESNNDKSEIKDDIIYTYKCIKCKKDYNSKFKNLVVRICDPCEI